MGHVKEVEEGGKVELNWGPLTTGLVDRPLHHRGARCHRLMVGRYRNPSTCVLIFESL